MKYLLGVLLLTLSLTSFSQTYLYIRNSTKVKCKIEVEGGPGVLLNPRTESGPFPFKHVINDIRYTINIGTQTFFGSAKNMRETPLCGEQVLEIRSWAEKRKAISIRVFKME